MGKRRVSHPPKGGFFYKAPSVLSINLLTLSLKSEYELFIKESVSNVLSDKLFWFSNLSFISDVLTI
jgi:hypothetical protein